MSGIDQKLEMVEAMIKELEDDTSLEGVRKIIGLLGLKTHYELEEEIKVRLRLEFDAEVRKCWGGCLD